MFKKYSYVNGVAALAILLISSVSHAMDSHELEEENDITQSQNSFDRCYTEEEFGERIQTSKFLKEMGDIGPLTGDEKEQINAALQDESTQYTVQVNRPIEDFKGPILVIGGGQSYGKDKSRGSTCIEGKLSLLNEIDGYKFHPLTGTLLNEESKQLEKLKLQAEVDEILTKNYTINYDKTTNPDVITSITDESGLSFIPSNRFDNVIFEGVPGAVFLNPTTWKVVKRFCKVGGTITSGVGVSTLRLLAIVLEETEWGTPILEQLKAGYSQCKNEGGTSFVFKNE